MFWFSGYKNLKWDLLNRIAWPPAWSYIQQKLKIKAWKHEDRWAMEQKMDYGRSKLSQQTWCVCILQLICRDHSLLPRLPVNQHRKHKGLQWTVILLCSSTRLQSPVWSTSMCLNHSGLCSRVNTRINGRDRYGVVHVFSVRPRV